MKKLIYLLTVVFLLATVLTAAIYIKAGRTVFLTLCITSETFSCHFVMRLIVGFVFQICMRNRADYRKWWYREKKWESRFYKRINVRKWKRFMPTYETSLSDVGRLPLLQAVSITN